MYRLARKSQLVDLTATSGSTSQAAGASNTSPGIPWWVWVAGGVLVTGVAAGAAYGYVQSTKPISGATNVTW